MCHQHTFQAKRIFSIYATSDGHVVCVKCVLQKCAQRVDTPDQNHVQQEARNLWRSDNRARKNGVATKKSIFADTQVHAHVFCVGECSGGGGGASSGFRWSKFNDEFQSGFKLTSNLA